ncbi:uncharacterized protein TNCV_1288411 [Trichonephila clavipes]|nr:uncharacterized protein TNCV_1288411 [Trichonephila clavipes]
MECGRSSLVVKVSDRGWLVTSSSPVPLKIRRVVERCTLNLSRDQTSSHWCSVVVRREGTSSGGILVTCPWFKMTRSVAKSPRVAKQCDVNIHSLILMEVWRKRRQLKCKSRNQTRVQNCEVVANSPCAGSQCNVNLKKNRFNFSGTLDFSERIPFRA